ncbi:hypothetical protein E3H11_36690 [Bradyrhizobium brasilense]|uniref:hypothetical protein n=1 Tax=Bradyrhizobium TaxID=374 RepID=UPI0014566901|nr:hypothetical protein [Bradyrhizobium brasilense]NLS74324.1 hypothetical protein [Bradyrhizobium brasilense]
MDRIDDTVSREDTSSSRDEQNARTVARSHQTIVFCGDAEQVRTGFALALDAMDAHADVLTTRIKAKGGPT